MCQVLLLIFGRSKRKEITEEGEGDPLPGLQNPPGAGCCHQLGPPPSPCSPKIEKLAQQRLFLRLCHLTGTLKAGKSKRNVPPLHPRALWGILLQAHSWRDERVWALPQLCSGTAPRGHGAGDGAERPQRCQTSQASARG